MTDMIIGQSESEQGFQESLLDYQALLVEAIRRVSVEPTKLVTQIRGLWPRIQKLGPTLVRLVDFDVRAYNKMAAYLAGLTYANSVYNIRLKPSAEFLNEVDEAMRLRQVMRADLESLVNHEVIDVDLSKLPEATKAYENIVLTLNDLSLVFRNNWSHISGKTPLAQNDLVRAELLAKTIQNRVGIREHGEKSLESASDMRDRAFTLAVNTYNETRAGVIFVRRNDGDADEIAPSLFAGRTGRNADKETEETVPEVQSPATVAKTPAVPGTPVLPREPGSDPFDT